MLNAMKTGVFSSNRKSVLTSNKLQFQLTSSNEKKISRRNSVAQTSFINANDLKKIVLGDIKAERPHRRRGSVMPSKIGSSKLVSERVNDILAINKTKEQIEKEQLE
jgi:hypothetical protein